MVVSWDAESLFGNEIDNGQTVSQREFSELVGCRSENSVRKWLSGLANSGRQAPIVLINGKPRLQKAEALALWAETHPDTPSAAPAKEKTEAQIEHLEILKLKKQDLAFEIARKQHEYYHKSEVRRVFEPMITAAKQKLGHLEDRLMPKLLVIADENRLQALEDRLLPLLPGDPEQNRQLIRSTIADITAASGEHEYRRIIRHVVNEAQTELADYDPRMLEGEKIGSRSSLAS